MNWRNTLIKLLGGYTQKEYCKVKSEKDRLKNKYQALLDSKTDNNCVTVANEYMKRLLHDLRMYAKCKLYGEDSQTWIDKIWNTIDNNYLKIETRYILPCSSIPYTLDTTLDKSNQFKQVIFEDKDEETIRCLLEEVDDEEAISHVLETDND